MGVFSDGGAIGATGGPCVAAGLGALVVGFAAARSASIEAAAAGSGAVAATGACGVSGTFGAVCRVDGMSFMLPGTTIGFLGRKGSAASVTASLEPVSGSMVSCFSIGMDILFSDIGAATFMGLTAGA